MILPHTALGLHPRSAANSHTSSVSSFGFSVVLSWAQLAHVRLPSEGVVRPKSGAGGWLPALGIWLILAFVLPRQSWALPEASALCWGPSQLGEEKAVEGPGPAFPSLLQMAPSSRELGSGRGPTPVVSPQLLLNLPKITGERDTLHILVQDMWGGFSLV